MARARQAGAAGVQRAGAASGPARQRPDRQDDQQPPAVGVHDREFRGAEPGQAARRRHSAPGRGARSRQRCQLVAVALGQEHRQVVGEGHGRGAGSGRGGEGAAAAARPRRSAGEVAQPGAHEGGGGVSREAKRERRLAPPSLPSPARGEGTRVARRLLTPSPSMGEGGVGVSRRAGLAMFVIGWLAAGSAVAGETAARITVAFDGFSMTSAPMYYADKKGIFGKFGIETKPTFIDGGSTLSHAVVGGSIDIAQNGYTPAITAAVQGADIVVIGGISNKLPYQLVVRAAFSEPQQLKAAKNPISRFAPSPD